jgi:hypothetical protein
MRDQPSTHKVYFEGGFLKRGFWLYVWEVTTPRRGRYYYVGRTGDSSSLKAQSPFIRMGQHLGPAENSSCYRTTCESDAFRDLHPRIDWLRTGHSSIRPSAARLTMNAGMSWPGWKRPWRTPFPVLATRS